VIKDRQQRRTRTWILALIVTLTMLVSPTGAYADTKRFPDSASDQPYAADIHTVVVRHAKRVRVAVHFNDFKITQYSTLTIWFDTRPALSGPEFVVILKPESSFTLRTSKAWKVGKNVPCPMNASFLMGRSEDAVLAVPRRCLGKPRKVRVSVRSTELYATRVFHDWAPAKRSFYPWVRR
jgi:hypothetical protein